MKRIVSFILFLFVLTASSQVHNYVGKDYTFTCSEELIPPVTSFMIGCEINEIPLTVLTGLTGVFMSTDPKMTFVFGDYLMKEKRIRISSVNIPYYLPTIKKAIVYHEIGHHMFGYYHIEDGPYILRSGPRLDMEYIIKNWEEIEKEYFIYIKENLVRIQEYQKQNQKVTNEVIKF